VTQQIHPQLIGLIPAAGIGARALDEAFRQAKQYRLIGGQPMLRRAVLALLAEPRIRHVVVAVAPDDALATGLLADIARVQVLACGGATRSETVRSALVQMQCEATDWVLVHDAARPGLPADALARLVDACLAQDRPGLLALPVVDTVKRAQTSEARQGGEQAQTVMVGQTIAREGLWLAQTPQMVRVGMLQATLATMMAAVSKDTPTDESAALERAGHAPLLVKGDARNFKVTWPEDFGLMEKWL